MIPPSSCFTLLVLACAAVELVTPAPTHSTHLSPALDTSAAYLQFFRVKQLIDDINLRQFRGFWSAPGTPPNPAPGQAVVDSVKKIEESVEDEPEEEAKADTEVTEAVEAASEVDTAALPVVDLTEEAILSDSVGISLPAILDTPLEAEVEEEVMVTTEAPVNSEDGDVDGATTAVAITEPQDGDDSLNEVNTGNDEFHVSEETASAARKYGYKILLKKVGGKEVPVGTIKYTIPTVVKTSAVEDALNVEDSSDDEEALVEDAELMVSADEAVVGEDEIPPETGTEDPPVPVLDDTDVATESIPIIDVIADEVSISEPSMAAAASPEVPAAQENVEETTTLLPIVDFLPDPITAVIPDPASISEAAMKLSEDMEATVAGIRSQGEVLVLGSCSVPVTEVETMLGLIARQVITSSNQL